MSVIDPRELRPLRDSQGPAQITGEAVALDVPAASLGWRALSGIIDLIARFGALYLLVRTAEALFPSPSVAVSAGLAIICLAVAFVIGPSAIEVSSMGQSLGKLITGLRVVRMDGGAISFRHSLTRNFVGLVETMLTSGGIALLTAALTTRSRRLGDLAAGTYVIRESRAASFPPPATMPPALAPWANTAAVMPLPASVAARLASVSRLRPVGNLSPYLMQTVQGTLREVLPFVAPPPPPGHSPFDVLVAIAVLRRDTDLRTINRDNETRERILRS